MFEVTSSMQGKKKKKKLLRDLELLKQSSLSARLKTGTSSLFKHSEKSAQLFKLKSGLFTKKTKPKKKQRYSATETDRYRQTKRQLPKDASLSQRFFTIRPSTPKLVSATMTISWDKMIILGGERGGAKARG